MRRLTAQAAKYFIIIVFFLLEELLKSLNTNFLFVFIFPVKEL